MDDKARYIGTLERNTEGNLRRLDNAISKMPEKVEKLETNLEGTKEKLVSAKKELKKPFEQRKNLRPRFYD